MSDTTETRVARVEQEVVGVNREIRDIKSRLDRSDEILTTIHKLTAQNEHILREIQEQDVRIKALEDRPRKHWDAIIGAVLGTGIGALVAWLIGR